MRALERKWQATGGASSDREPARPATTDADAVARGVACGVACALQWRAPSGIVAREAACALAQHADTAVARGVACALAQTKLQTNVQTKEQAAAILDAAVARAVAEAREQLGAEHTAASGRREVEASVRFAVLWQQREAALHAEYAAVHAAVLEQQPPAPPAAAAAAAAAATTAIAPAAAPPQLARAASAPASTSASALTSASASEVKAVLARALQQQRLLAPAKVQAEVKVQAAPGATAPLPGAMAATKEAVLPPPQGAAAGGGDGDDGGEEEEQENGFLLRQMALRQYVEVLRQPALSGRSSVKPWKLTLRRDALCTDVLAAMSKVRGHGELWRQTQVVFIDRHGRPEDGIDDGGEWPQTPRTRGRIPTHPTLQPHAS